MRILEIAALTILFLLIPHQAPLADGSGAVAPGEQIGPASGDDALLQEAAGRAEARTHDGFAWSVATAASEGYAPSSSSEPLQTDGYSWSARSAEAVAAPDSNF